VVKVPLRALWREKGPCKGKGEQKNNAKRRKTAKLRRKAFRGHAPGKGFPKGTAGTSGKEKFWVAKRGDQVEGLVVEKGQKGIRKKGETPKGHCHKKNAPTWIWRGKIGRGKNTRRPA